MVTVGMILLVASFVLALLAGVNVPSGTRVNLLALAFACFVLALLIGGIHIGNANVR